MLRLPLAIFAAICFAVCAHAQNGRLVGTIEGNTYISPTGTFKITIPVLPQLGGRITDTPNVVTFQDAFNVHVTIAAFPQDATQRWELTVRGKKDYLVYFFSRFVLPDFKQTFGAEIQSATFLPEAFEGSLLTYLLVPGGTMFADRVPSMGFAVNRPVAKRGNLLFVRNEFIYVLSVELAERVTEGPYFNKTTEEEDEILRERLNDIVAKMTFAPVRAVETAGK